MNTQQQLLEEVFVKMEKIRDRLDQRFTTYTAKQALIDLLNVMLEDLEKDIKQ